jgi:hypothetical protein
MTTNNNTHCYPTSSVLNNKERTEDKQSSFLNKSALGFIVILISASISTEIEYNPTPLTPSSTLSYQTINSNYTETLILQNFISNLIQNSEDIDDNIVELVNENFWDLI